MPRNQSQWMQMVSSAQSDWLSLDILRERRGGFGTHIILSLPGKREGATLRMSHACGQRGSCTASRRWSCWRFVIEESRSYVPVGARSFIRRERPCPQPPIPSVSMSTRRGWNWAASVATCQNSGSLEINARKLGSQSPPARGQGSRQDYCLLRPPAILPIKPSR